MLSSFHFLVGFLAALVWYLVFFNNTASSEGCLEEDSLKIGSFQG